MSGLVKSPEVSEISASEGTPGQPLTLGCQMSGFYPPEIKVHWLRVHRDQEEALSEGLALWGPIETHPYIFRASAQASVPDRGTEGGNGGSLIKCIIEHSSLERPLERQWRHTCTGKTERHTCTGKTDSHTCTGKTERHTCTGKTETHLHR
nr:PREDICTED: SMH class II histocompatibility antigen, beta-1 chain-like isoform X2 [Lepisosteus oculatus]